MSVSVFFRVLSKYMDFSFDLPYVVLFLVFVGAPVIMETANSVVRNVSAREDGVIQKCWVDGTGR
jgi:hypothetical protein